MVSEGSVPPGRDRGSADRGGSDQGGSDRDGQDLVNELLHAAVAVSHALERINRLAGAGGDEAVAGKIEEAIGALTAARERLLRDADGIVAGPEGAPTES